MVSVQVPDRESAALNEVKRGNYIDLLEPDEHYMITPARQVGRLRISNTHGKIGN